MAETSNLSFFIIRKTFKIEVSLIYVSGVWQSDSIRHVSILFQILFPFRLLENSKQSSLSVQKVPVGYPFSI